MGIANVLITEDNVDLQIELTDFLEFNGYPTQAVDTLASMNEKLSTDQFDFLVLDFGLPDGDGLAAIPSIRKRFGRSLGIIALTARGQPKERVAGLEAGADYYLVKPTYLPELKAVLEHLQSYIEKPTIDWVLNLSQQQLMSPNGQLTTLTGTEVLLLQMLSKSDSMVDREQLSSSIFHVSVGDTRRLDTLVCRLRNKVVKKTGLSLPLTTYRNKGYQLGAMMIQE
ncbi:MAG: response regulator transcription factor [Bacterioplanes sp.]|nr:response regulator transcription factor [Bacterioplanes sp.]